MGNSLATQMAPPFVLVAHYIIAGVVFYFITSLLLPFFVGEIDSFFVSTKIASLMHLYLLGFVMMIIFGAMYQLIPVVLEIPIFSKDFAYVQFYTYVVGIVIFTSSLFFDDSLISFMPYGGILIYLSMLIFVTNVFLTYTKLETYTISAKYILVSNIFLLVGVSIGLFMALNMIHGFYAGDMIALTQAHIVATIGGYVIMTSLGVGIILLPMFSLSHGFSQKPIEYAFYLITLGVSIYIVNVFYDNTLISLISLALIIVAAILGIYQMWLIFTTRIRKQYDAWAKNMIASFLFLVISVFVLIFLHFSDDGKVVMLFGFIIFFGFFVFFIVGHIYKILPFLVWFQRYSPLVGKMKVPMLHEMILENVANWQFYTTLIGTLIVALSILFGIHITFVIGAVLMCVGTLFIIYNVRYTLIYGIEHLKDIKK